MKDTFCTVHNGGYSVFIYIPQMCTFSVCTVSVIRKEIWMLEFTQITKIFKMPFSCDFFSFYLLHNFLISFMRSQDIKVQMT